MTFSGCLRKRKADEPRSLGAADFLTNGTGREYRLIRASYVLDTTGLRPGEAAESDVGFTVLGYGAEVALNSGEEALMNHYYDAVPRLGDVVEVNFPSGGLRVPAGSRLSVGSVTGIFPQAGGGAIHLPDSRIAGSNFMRLCYIATLIRADAAQASVESYRSPYRDRSYVAHPGRPEAPYTDFKNTSAAPVKIYGVGVFLSNVTGSEPSQHQLEILVNGSVVQQVALPAHEPGKTTSALAPILPVNITLKPGDWISVRAKVVPHRAIVFDFAAYIFADAGLTQSSEHLNIMDADLNGDGQPDIVDLDSKGSLWVSLTVGNGHQNTQTEWANGLRTLSSLSIVPNQQKLLLRGTNSEGLCMDLRPEPSIGRFILNYCKDTPGVATDWWGDFNGDGFPDRLRRSNSELIYTVALGSASGLQPEYPAVVGFGAVDRLFVSDANGDGMDDFEAEWSDSTGFRCVIWEAARTSFVEHAC